MSDVLIVHDVGHGNWNQIKSDEYTVFFDIGADKYYGKEDIRALIQKSGLEETERFSIVISHWDVDHYHVLFKMEKSELRKIEKVIAPTPPANIKGETPKTIARVIELLEDENICIEFIPKSRKLDNSTQKVEIHFSCVINSYISLYRTTGAKNKNLDSIVLYYEGNDKSIVLTGDNYYNKVYEFILAPRTINKLIMVVPHHGGLAGKFIPRDWASLSTETVICSWGINNYGHSLTKLIKVFNGTFSRIEETNGTGSIQTYL
ncbi:ComEC/Rec2 family competence protein [Planococcus maritimus]|uniref:hypothetical protein n=1 Tax=Planococcus maritimus TaxID=192421 RepID=UPI0007960087|nr:hypothetical protein [Planococcus maritimus]KYG57880.1 hypothetical protein AY633_12980 [Planococcus maritimus]OED31634.1 hypothetical protein BHE17_03435 [Planococcus maritimus]